MPISVKWNSSYGGSLVTSKYSPLENIEVGSASSAYWSGLPVLRMETLRGLSLLQGIGLATPNWEAVAAVESRAGRRPPLVVVSSGRAEWIREGVAAAQEYLDGNRVALGQAYWGVGDMRAVGIGEKDRSGRLVPGTPPPIYAPSRVGTQRSVYVVVHMMEYHYYSEQLRNTEVNVVGWQFRGAGNVAKRQMAGFGASRFAALQLCKTLRTGIPQPGQANLPAADWGSAWVFDDNVVALSNFPAPVPGPNQHSDGLSDVEDDLTANVGPGNWVCAGFQAGTKALGLKDVRDQAQTELGQPAATLPARKEVPGLVQQAVLWNITELVRRNISIGPGFIASAEDVSFVNYLKRLAGKGPALYQQYTRISVRKYAPTTGLSDQANKGAARVNSYREQLEGICAREESDGDPAANVPPPVMLDAGTGGVPVSGFVEAHAGGAGAQAVDVGKAACQAVEQLMAEVLAPDKSGTTVPLTDDAINALFTIPMPQDSVQCRNAPLAGGQ
ncbi:hypothetical protein [Streptomyces sp. NPDC001889]